MPQEDRAVPQEEPAEHAQLSTASGAGPDLGQLPQLAGHPMVTDGGMETDFIFHHGVDLPLFAAFPLVNDPAGRLLLTGYYDEYAVIARRAGAGLMLESATWRANPDWGAQLGYSPANLARVNRDAITMLAAQRQVLRDRHGLADVVISGMVGDRDRPRRPHGRGTGGHLLHRRNRRPTLWS